jgi:NAD(P)-dependent dehydrogenase (short-subunit alcohol dehydrogenase family)
LITGGSSGIGLEQAATMYLAERAKRDRDAKDFAILNKHSGRLNREAEVALGYQDLPW